MDVVRDIGSQMFNGEEEVGTRKVGGHNPEGDGGGGPDIAIKKGLLLSWGETVDQEGGGDLFSAGNRGRDTNMISLSDVFYGR